MDLYGRKTVWSFLEEDQRGPQSPAAQHRRRNHHHRRHSGGGGGGDGGSVSSLSDIVQQPRLSLSRPSSATVTSSFSPSSPGPPGSPWAFSPLHLRSPSPSSSPSVLYHCLASLQREDGNVYAIAVSRGVVFTGSDSDRVRVWKQPYCADRGFIRTGHGRVQCILAHGSAVFTSHKDHKVRVWTVSVTPVDGRLRYKKLATLPPSSFLSFHRKKPHHHHRDVVSCLALHHTDGILYTGSGDRTVKAWRLAERACVDSFLAHDGQVTAMVVNQVDGCLYTSSADGAVKIWRRTYGGYSHALTVALRPLQHSPANALALSHSTSSCFLYSGSSDGYINVWEKEAESGRYNSGGPLQGHRYAVLSLAVVDRILLSGSEDTTIRVWRREAAGLHTCLAVIEGHRGPVRCLAACLEVEREGVGLLLYSASLDKMLKVWRIKVVAGKEKEEEEVVMAAAGDEDEEEGRKAVADVEFDLNPVLSPLWVEKKRHASHLHRGD